MSEETPKQPEAAPRHLWVNGVVAVRDGKPYIQLSNENGIIAQMTMAEARQFADDIVQMCARTEADALIIDWLQADLQMPHEAAALIMAKMRDFRADQDAARPRENGGAERTE